MTMKRYRFGFGLVLAALVLMAGGCQVLGVASSRTASPTVKAKYVPAKVPMLVLVEHYHLMLDSEIESQHLQAALEKTLSDNHVAPVVGEDHLQQLRDADSPAYDKMTIDGIGRALRAPQVLYVNITTAEIEQPEGGTQMRGRMAASVQIVDSATGSDRLDPTSVSIETHWMSANETTPNDLRAQTADQLAEDIGRLFYDWQPDDKTSVNTNQ